jgi:hypothetical protein
MNLYGVDKLMNGTIGLYMYYQNLEKNILGHTNGEILQINTRKIEAKLVFLLITNLVLELLKERF